MSQLPDGSAATAPVSRRSPITIKALSTALVLGLVGLGAGAGTWSAFSDTTENADNQFAAGTVTISDNDADGRMFQMSGMKPGDFDEGCILIEYTGSLAADVRLHGVTTGTGLDQHLDVTVTRGTKTGTSAFDSCTDFSADATDYAGQGAGVVYKGTLQGYPDSWAAGIVDAPGTGNAETWTTSEKHAYKIRVELPSTASSTAAGLSANQQFTWEAQNQ